MKRLIRSKVYKNRREWFSLIFKTRRFILQLKSTSDCHNQDKSLNEHTMRVLQDDVSSLKFQLSEVKRRECSVSDRFIDFIRGRREGNRGSADDNIHKNVFRFFFSFYFSFAGSF